MITLTVNLPDDKEVSYRIEVPCPRAAAHAPLYCSAVTLACEQAMTVHADWTSMVIVLGRRP